MYAALIKLDPYCAEGQRPDDKQRRQPAISRNRNSVLGSSLRNLLRGVLLRGVLRLATTMFVPCN